jgi:uncharacterized protein (DUF1015 family)
MAEVRPFHGVLPAQSKAELVAAPPYDVVDREEGARIAEANAYCFLRVSRAEIELSPELSPYAPSVYTHARRNYMRLKAVTPLSMDGARYHYVYRLTMGRHVQTGIITTASLDDYEQNTIVRHERTRPEKVKDRTDHILALGAQTGPVFLTYPDVEAIDAVVAQVVTTAPVFDVRRPDGVQHTLWRVPLDRVHDLTSHFRAVPRLYIADGHHRAESASRVREICRGQNLSHTGREEYNRFLAVVFPSSQLQILPYNRVVSDLNGLSAEAFLDQARAHFRVKSAASPTPSEPGTIHAFLEGAWWELQFTGDLDRLSDLEALDVSLLQDHVLGPILGIEDPTTDDRIDFVGGIRGAAELEKRVRERRAAVAFALYPTRIDQVMSVSDAGKVMPPKSTWFEPKLADGLVIHEI